VLRDTAGETFSYKPANEEAWRGFEVGSTYKATLSPQGELVSLGELVAKAPPPEEITSELTTGEPEAH
jgi:hypothetical protein